MTKVWKSKLRNSDERLKASGSNCQKDLTQEQCEDCSRYPPTMMNLQVQLDPMVLTDPEGAIAIGQQTPVQEDAVKAAEELDEASFMLH
mmetsp:Transcript_4389/g.8135  ORF Transcript_4389/g.8135 Transcript_4389/m.8135 type:complete len:89 (+) Transcript_4389:218-484(+)